MEARILLKLSSSQRDCALGKDGSVQAIISYMPLSSDEISVKARSLFPVINTII
jgi:hypothetical protein